MRFAGQTAEVLKILDNLVPDVEQVIEVPKILPEDVPMRITVRDTQLAEQLVEVPTIVSYSSLRGLVEQNVDTPVPHGRGRVGGGGLFSLHPGQSSTAFGGAEHRFPAATAEQIVDIPVPRGGRQDPDLPSAASSSGLPGTANQGFFRTFPVGKKCAVWSALGVGTAPRVEPIHAGGSAGGFLHGRSWCVCSSQAVGGNFWAQIQKFGGLGEGWDGALVMRQPTNAFGRISSCFPVLCARAVWCIISFVLASGSHCSGRLGVAEECGN